MDSLLDSTMACRLVSTVFNDGIVADVVSVARDEKCDAGGAAATDRASSWSQFYENVSAKFSAKFFGQILILSTFGPNYTTTNINLPWRRGIVVIASAYRTENPGFESRQGVRFRSLYIAVSKLNMHCQCVFGNK
jgi:hypothetical protein